MMCKPETTSSTGNSATGANAWENNRQGLPKAKLHIDDPGFTIGGPVKIPGLFDEKENKKLFFFYSFEAPQVQKPGPIRLYRMPTALERQGDFSQTLDANGKLMFIKDPLLAGACSVTTAWSLSIVGTSSLTADAPGCADGSVVALIGFVELAASTSQQVAQNDRSALNAAELPS